MPFTDPIVPQILPHSIPSPLPSPSMPAAGRRGRSLRLLAPSSQPITKSKQLNKEHLQTKQLQNRLKKIAFRQEKCQRQLKFDPPRG